MGRGIGDVVDAESQADPVVSVVVVAAAVESSVARASEDGLGVNRAVVAVDPFLGASAAVLTVIFGGWLSPGEPDGGFGHAVFDLAGFDHELLTTVE